MLRRAWRSWLPVLLLSGSAVQAQTVTLNFLKQEATMQVDGEIGCIPLAGIFPFTVPTGPGFSKFPLNVTTPLPCAFNETAIGQATLSGIPTSLTGTLNSAGKFVLQTPLPLSINANVTFSVPPNQPPGALVGVNLEVVIYDLLNQANDCSAPTPYNTNDTGIPQWTESTGCAISGLVLSTTSDGTPAFVIQTEVIYTFWGLERVTFSFYNYYTMTTAPPSSGLDDSTFVPDPTPGSICPVETQSVALPKVISMPQPPSPRVVNPVLQAVAGSTTPSTGTVNVICKTTGGCTAGVPFTVMIIPQTGGSWLSFTTPDGTKVVGSASVPIKLSATPKGLAVGTYTATLQVTGNFPTLTSTVTLNVLPPDSITITGDQPVGTTFDPTQPVSVRTLVNFVLSSRCTVNLVLIANDDTGTEFRSMPPTFINSGPLMTEGLSIQPFTLKPTVKTVTLKAVFLDVTTNQPFLTSNSLVYYAAHISLNLTLPNSGDPLIAVSPQLPPFCGSGTYTDTYAGPNKAHIYLELLDQNGKFIGRTSQAQDLPTGMNLSWGGGCTDPAQLIYITEQLMPKYNITAGTPYNQTVGTLTLQASLYDSVTQAKLATSSPVAYKVEPGVDLTAQLQLTGSPANRTININPSTNGFVSRGNVTSLPSSLGLGVDPNDSFFSLSLQTTLDFDGTSGLLDALITQMDSNGKILAVDSTTDSTTVQRGTQIKSSVAINGLLATGAAIVTIEPRLTLPSGQSVLFSEINLGVENVTITQATPGPGDCLSQLTIKNIKNCPVGGAPMTFQFKGVATPALSGEQLVRSVVITTVSGKNASSTTNMVSASFTPGQTSPFSDSVNLDLPSDIKSLAVSYQLYRPGMSVSQACGSCAGDKREYFVFLYTNSLTLATDEVNVVLTLANGALHLLGIKVPTKVNNWVSDLNLANTTLQNAHFLKGAQNVLPFAAPSRDGVDLPRASTSTASPTLTGIASTWFFDTPIAHDGSFAATLSLNYSSAELPDDPNFSEPSMQMISFDPSGALHTYQTTVDTVNKVATATIDGLDQYFSLAVVGQASQTPVMLASAPTGYALVNTGTQNSTVSVTAYADNGGGSPTTSTLKVGNQQLSTTPAWVQAWADSPSVAGVSWFSSGSASGGLFAVTPAGSPGGAFIFSDVEYDTLKSTEIDLANTSPFDANIAIGLFGADGSALGTYTTVLAAKNSFAGHVEGLFPSIQPGFSGYAMVTSNQTMVASGYRWTNSAVTGLVAQPIDNASFSANTLYAPQLAGTGTVSALHLVNAASTTANLTLKAWTASGTPAATAVQMQLASGQQYTNAVTSIFAIAPSTAGSIEVDTDTPGIFGDVLTIDSSFVPAYAVSIPLSIAPGTSYVLPYATPTTTAYVFNPSSTAANVTVTPYGADGTPGSPATATVPANGRAAIGVSANAYATVASNQPVVASGWMVVPSGATTGYPALPAVALPTGPVGGGSGPQITPGGVVNAADYAAKVSRGALAFAFGSNLASQSGQANALPLPLSMGGASVTVAGVPAPVFVVSTTFVEFQVPYEVPLGASIPVVVTYNGAPSNVVNVTVADYAVGVFTYNRTPTIVDPDVFHLNGSLLTPTAPAVPGETVIVIANGIGKLNNPPGTGNAVGPPYPTAVDTPVVRVGGVPAVPQYSGLLAGLLGVVQMNVQLPASLPSGSLPMVIQFPGDSSPVVNLYVSGNVASAPKLSLSANSLAFGNVTVGQTESLTVQVSNIGSAPLTVSSMTVSGPGFTIVSPPTPFSVQPGGSQTVTLSYAPSSTASVGGTLTIISNDASSPAFVSLSAAGIAAAVPAISVSPTSLNFGTVTVGQTKDMTVNVSNTGGAQLIVSSLTASTGFLVTSPSTPLNVAPGGSSNVTVRFAPSSAAADAGTLTITSNDPKTRSVVVQLSGTGAAASSGQSVVLQVDGGTFNSVTGFSNGQTGAVFVNRLTPPSYPATLESVEIFFGNRVNGLSPNTPITLVAGTNPSGSANFNATFALTPTQVSSVGSFTVYPVSPMTITSGDFIVGFQVDNPVGIYPADTDRVTPSQGRSYFAAGNYAFTLLDSIPGLAGNLAIRATVTVSQ